jgi:hypothetical protein
MAGRTHSEGAMVDAQLRPALILNQLPGEGLHHKTRKRLTANGPIGSE